ncbi:hypothetical protein [Nocardia cyriacigeorgica]|nr:hypothetical protein [Nocardia cyriacigeorgica]
MTDGQLRQRYRRLNPLVRISIWLVAFGLVAGVVVWVGNPNLGSDAAEGPASEWTAPSESVPTTTVAPPPPGFPRMEFPPPMPEVPEGVPQPVPTRFGLTYTVPSSEHWRSSNTMVVGWTDDAGDVATYGAVSEYRYGYCTEDDGSAMATVGVTGRNAVDLDTAARQEVSKAERIFGDEETSRKPKVEIRGPFSLEVSGRPAVRYTAVLTDIPGSSACGPDQAIFDVVATPGYATAEVVLLVVQHHTGMSDALSESDADAIVTSLRKSD